MDGFILIYAIMVAILGACIGSFLNVVIFRLPEGMSLVTPPSHCTACNYHLVWYDNIPVVSWFILDAKCRNCGAKISSQYPIVEGGTSLLFTILFMIYFSDTTYHAIFVFGPEPTWPVVFTHLLLVGALIAATVIDARTLTIPPVVTEAVFVIAVLLLPFATGVAKENFFLVPTASGHGVGIALGGGVGLLASLGLLFKKIIPRSFEIDDNDQWVVNGKPAGPAFGPAPVEPVAGPAAQPLVVESAAATPDAAAKTETPAVTSAPPPPGMQWLRHPNPRGEMGKELMFLALPILGAIVGYFMVPAKGPEGRVTDAMGFEHVIRLAGGWTNLPMWQHVLAGVVLGALVGGGIIWGARIFGTYLFGKEAMGLGDVHLLAVIGAVVGAPATLVVFGLGAILGLVGAIVTGAANNMLSGKDRFREIPFGPYLAAATVVVLMFHDPVTNFVLYFQNSVGALFSDKL